MKLFGLKDEMNCLFPLLAMLAIAGGVIAALLIHIPLAIGKS